MHQNSMRTTFLNRCRELVIMLIWVFLHWNELFSYWNLKKNIVAPIGLPNFWYPFFSFCYLSFSSTVWSSEIDHPYFLRIFHLTLMNERCHNVPTSNGGVWGRVCSATPTHLPRPPSLKNPKIIIFTNF